MIDIIIGSYFVGLLVVFIWLNQLDLVEVIDCLFISMMWPVLVPILLALGFLLSILLLIDITIERIFNG